MRAATKSLGKKRQRLSILVTFPVRCVSGEIHALLRITRKTTGQRSCDLWDKTAFIQFKLEMCICWNHMTGKLPHLLLSLVSRVVVDEARLLLTVPTACVPQSSAEQKLQWFQQGHHHPSQHSSGIKDCVRWGQEEDPPGDPGHLQNLHKGKAFRGY